MCTFTGDIRDKVYGLEQLGTDDYLAKPSDFAELVARGGALSRRAPNRHRSSAVGRHRPGPCQARGQG